MMSRAMYGLAACAALVVFASIKTADGHAFMSVPNARGTLSGIGGQYKFQGVDHSCPTDYCPMCQNADFLQHRNGGEQFRLYTPMDRTKSMRGNFGMCGDGSDAWNADHMKKGQFSIGCEGKATITGLNPGSHIDFQIQSTAHHQGFFEFFLCDTTNCGGDMNRNCFYQNQCVQLMRVPVKSCEDGYDTECAPIDPNFPGRWYMPCHKYPFLFQGTSEMTEDQTLGGTSGKMKYMIPNDFNCGQNCVIQSYWVTANICNPPGMKSYFDNLYSQNKLTTWNQCDGDGITKGGYAPSYKDCGQDGLFPEEFWNCGDVHMNGNRYNRHNYDVYYQSGNMGTKKLAQISSASITNNNIQPSNAGIDCYQNGERAQGAPGKPAVPYKDCCDATAQQLENPSKGWGKFCTPAVGASGGSSNGGENCYETGQRAQGAPGYPAVEYKPCCDSRAEQVPVPSKGFGKFCEVSGSQTNRASDSNDGCVACLEAKRDDCYMCKHPRDRNNRTWFITGYTRWSGSERQFQICLHYAPHDNSNFCWWCYENTNGQAHRCG